MNDDISFPRICNLWAEEKRRQVKPTSMAAYMVSIDKYLLSHFSKLSDVNSESVQNFISEKIMAGLSVKSIKDILVVLKMIMKYAVSSGYKINWNYKAALPKEIKSKDITVFTTVQQKKLMDYLTSNWNYKNLGILICLTTGLRIGEICGLKWADINFEMSSLSINKSVYRLYFPNSQNEKSRLIVNTPKTRHSYRTIPLPSNILKLITEYNTDRNKDYFIVSNSSKPMEPRNYRNYFHQLLRSLDLPILKFHSLRHSFATRCIENNCDYKTVSAILGHADISTTLNLYVHPSAEQKRSCIEKMVESLNKYPL